MENNSVNKHKVHTISIFSRQKTEIVGAIEVLSSTEKESFVKLEKEYLHIIGDGLKIIKLNPEEELLIIGGCIKMIEYISSLEKKSILKRIFK